MRGEIAVELLTWRPQRFAEVQGLRLERQGQAARELRLESWRQDTRGILVKFAGIDTPEAARAEVVGGYLTIPRQDVAPLPAGTFYVFDVVGCQVIDEQGRQRGEVTEVLEMPASDVYAVRLTEGGQALLPAVRDFVRDIDVDNRRIVVCGVDDLFGAEKS